MVAENIPVVVSVRARVMLNDTTTNGLSSPMVMSAGT